ncbi:MAG: hypothetical protein V3U75_12160 [Methylococcaceae bacterium]
MKNKRAVGMIIFTLFSVQVIAQEATFRQNVLRLPVVVVGENSFNCILTLQDTNDGTVVFELNQCDITFERSPFPGFYDSESGKAKLTKVEIFDDNDQKTAEISADLVLVNPGSVPAFYRVIATGAAQQ